ncbi:hypothetical protein [Acinetobacter sp. WZC-1]|uniref:hypothetical protein n=1 Tax=Acinetobacter sp. WZC-1 TaxID=3459034 RepID=UPI00403DF3A3
MIIFGKIVEYIFVLLFFVSPDIYAVGTQNIPKKIFELDLTDERVSTQGGDIEVLKSKNYCILVLNLYGEMGQEKYAFRFNQKRLINTRHVGYKYPVNVYEMKPDTKIIVDFDRTYGANQNRALFKKFNIYKKRIPNKVLKQCYS